jgi:hypothetical protein
MTNRHPALFFVCGRLVTGKAPRVHRVWFRNVIWIASRAAPLWGGGVVVAHADFRFTFQTAISVIAGLDPAIHQLRRSSCAD